MATRWGPPLNDLHRELSGIQIGFGLVFMRAAGTIAMGMLDDQAVCPQTVSGRASLSLNF